MKGAGPFQNAYLGQSEISWLTVHHGLSKFGTNIDEARFIYSTYILKKECSEDLEELRSRFKDGQVLGDDDFLCNIREKNDGGRACVTA